MFFAYLRASKPYGTLYVGSTSSLQRRVWEHKNKVVPGFTSRYGVDRLVWFESPESVLAAILREKQIKEWRRKHRPGPVLDPLAEARVPQP
jgi:putative endonuclease